MSTNLENQPVPNLFDLLFEQYTQDALGNTGEASKPAPIKRFADGRYAEATHPMQQVVKDFKEFCKEFLRDNPPESVASLSQGFGLRLAGGFEVSLCPSQVSDNMMQDAGDVPVTTPRSIRYKHGIEPSTSVDVTKGG